MPEQTKEKIHKAVRVDSYSDLLKLINRIALCNRSSFEGTVKDDIHFVYALDEMMDVVVTVSGGSRTRTLGLIHSLLIDGYASPPEERELRIPTRGAGYMVPGVILHEKIISDIQQRKWLIWGSILKWGLGYVIAATLTVIGTLIVHKIIDKPTPTGPVITTTSQPAK